MGFASLNPSYELTATDRQKIFEGNAFKVYPWLKNAIAKQAGAAAHA